MDGFVMGLCCALGIARRGETTHSGVDVNNTHPSMINPLNQTLEMFTWKTNVLSVFPLYYIPVS